MNALINEYPLVFLPSLAVQHGLNEAIVIQQIHYWSNKLKPHDDGLVWVYNTIPEWKKQFPFWSERTIFSILKKLRESGVLIAESKSNNLWDRTLYYRIDYEKLGHTISQPLQDGDRKLCKNTIYTETTREYKADSKPTSLEIPNCIDKIDWEDFLAMRKKIGKPMTDRAMKILFNKLLKMKEKGIDISVAIQNSILNSWADVYEPKVQTQQNSMERRVL